MVDPRIIDGHFAGVVGDARELVGVEHVERVEEVAFRMSRLIRRLVARIAVKLEGLDARGKRLFEAISLVFDGYERVVVEELMLIHWFGREGRFRGY